MDNGSSQRLYYGVTKMEAVGRRKFLSKAKVEVLEMLIER